MRTVYWTELEFAAFMVKHSLVVGVQYSNNEHYGRVVGLTSYKGIYEVHLWCAAGAFEKKIPFWEFIKGGWKLNGENTFQLIQSVYRKYTDDEAFDLFKAKKCFSLKPKLSFSGGLTHFTIMRFYDGNVQFKSEGSTYHTLEGLLSGYTYQDGSPFGIEVE